MDIVSELLATSLNVVIRLGIPVAVLFFVGLQLYQSSARQEGLAGTGAGPGGMRAGCPAGQATEEEASALSCAFKRAAVEQASPPPVVERGGVPCWQSMKMQSGRLSSRCLNCESFLNVSMR
jgi:hypothetical protein